MTRFNLTFCYSYLHQFAEAFAEAEKVKQLVAEANNPWLQGIPILGLASIYWHQGKHIRAFLLALKGLWTIRFWQDDNGMFAFKLVINRVIDKISQFIRQKILGEKP